MSIATWIFQGLVMFAAAEYMHWRIQPKWKRLGLSRKDFNIVLAYEGTGEYHGFLAYRIARRRRREKTRRKRSIIAQYLTDRYRDRAILRGVFRWAQQ